MFKPFKTTPRAHETVITQGVYVHGDLKSEHDVWVDGHFSGTIITSGRVIVTSNALVEASIQAQHVTVSGQILGGVTSDGLLTITETGRLVGDVTCHQLDTAQGAVLVGNVTTDDPEDVTYQE